MTDYVATLSLDELRALLERPVLGRCLLCESRKVVLRALFIPDWPELWCRRVPPVAGKQRAFIYELCAHCARNPEEAAQRVEIKVAELEYGSGPARSQ